MIGLDLPCLQCCHHDHDHGVLRRMGVVTCCPHCLGVCWDWPRLLVDLAPMRSDLWPEIADAANLGEMDWMASPAC